MWGEVLDQSEPLGSSQGASGMEPGLRTGSAQSVPDSVSSGTPRRGLGVADSGSGARCCPPGTRGEHCIQNDPTLSPPPAESGRSLVKSPGRGRECPGSAPRRENLGGLAPLGLLGEPGPACRAVRSVVSTQKVLLSPFSRRSPGEETSPMSLDPSAWVTPAPASGEGGRVFCPVPNVFVS